LLLLAATTGCIHVYQPMAGFHGPVVVDPQARNFGDLSLTVVCERGDLLTAAEARTLCQHVGTLFEQQGAVVTTTTSESGAGEFEFEEPAVPGEEEAPPPATDLTLELTSRELHKANDPVSWVLFFISATVVPAVTETSFAVDVTIKDESGFVLVADSLQGRLVRRMGVGAWGTNFLLDSFLREDADRITGDAAHQDLSDDLYGQLGQLLFNAKMQWQVLSQAAAAPSLPGAPP